MQDIQKTHLKLCFDHCQRSVWRLIYFSAKASCGLALTAFSLYHKTKRKNASNGNHSSQRKKKNNSSGRKKTEMESRRDGEGGRNPPECKVMFRRNVQPPVVSCNFTGNNPDNSLTHRLRVGGKMMAERGGRGRVAQEIAHHFIWIYRLEWSLLKGAGKCCDMRWITTWQAFFSCQRICC